AISRYVLSGELLRALRRLDRGAAWVIPFGNPANERVLNGPRRVIPPVSRCRVHRAISGGTGPRLRLAACLRSAVAYEGLLPSLLRGRSPQVRCPPPAICGRLHPH